jgi:hypothetical protein
MASLAILLNVPSAVQERIQRLRQEVAEIAKENKRWLHVKGEMAMIKQTRRIQRMQEILDELLALCDWKKP